MAQYNQTHSQMSGTITEAITQYEQQWAAAAKANDATTVASLLSEIFVEVDSDGTLRSRSEVLERLKHDQWQVNEVGDVKVVVHGGTAIATGTWRGKGTLANGKVVDAHERWLDTWMKNGKWQCVASASAPLTA